MLTAKEANRIYIESVMPSDEKILTDILVKIEHQANCGKDYLMYIPERKLSQYVLDMLVKLGYSIDGYVGMLNFQYHIYWGLAELLPPKCSISEYDDSMDYTRD